MKPFEVFYAQTQVAVNFLYIFVMCILPMLWFGDCKKTMSLLFKKIGMPNFRDDTEMLMEFPRNLQLLLILLGAGSYCLHRCWRLHLQDVRCDAIKKETSFTETHELHELKLKLLQRVDRVIEEKILNSLRRADNANLYNKRNVCIMENIAEENRESASNVEDDGDKKTKKKLSPTKRGASPRKVT